jgi:hypothetical protein
VGGPEIAEEWFGMQKGTESAGDNQLEDPTRVTNSALVSAFCFGELSMRVMLEEVSEDCGIGGVTRIELVQPPR